MFYIRLFLWGLVAAMTLHGALHADEYGTAASLVGGVTMTMSVWSESVFASIKGFLTAEPKFVGLPRALVTVAIQESARHPIIKTLPRLKSTMESHQRTWSAFRDEYVSWSLRHMDLIGGLQTEGAYVWNFWTARARATAAALNRTNEERCIFPESMSACQEIEEEYETLAAKLQKEQAAESAWSFTLGFWDSSSSRKAERWWSATQEEDLRKVFVAFQEALKRLHNVTEVTDSYLQFVLRHLPSTDALVDPWIRRLLASLGEGDVWSAAMDHVRAREARVRDLMITAGVQELWAAHERTLAASIKAVAEEKHGLVRDWFGESASYAWWMPDEVPGIVRRCIGQEGGDCIRIGPTEIQGIAAQHVERNRILEDWTRRLFIGMWNAMPIIGILFVLEIVVLLLPQRRIVHIVEGLRPELEERLVGPPAPPVPVKRLTRSRARSLTNQ
jgi:hypothetical protein